MSDDPIDQTERPIRGLTEQELEPSSAFMVRVRRRIHRRSTVSQLASFSWGLPKAIVTEMAGIIRHLFLSLGGGKES